MKKIKNILFIAGLSLWMCFPLFGQEIPVGHWMAHLPYNDVFHVTEVGDRIYGVTGSAVFYYDKTDNSVNALSKTTGLSDVGMNTMAYDPATTTLVLGYSNSNIDLLASGTIFNMPDIKRKSIPGDKTIYKIEVIDGKAYLACGFGIVVLDLANREISDTYYITSGNTAVLDLACYQDTIYAASEMGLHKAPMQGQNLSDFNFWQIVDGVPEKKIDEVEVYQSMLFVNLVGDDEDSSLNDTLMYFQNNSWDYFDEATPKTTKSISVSADNLLITQTTGVYWYNTGLQLLHSFENPISPEYAIIDQTGTLWIADSYAGMIRDASPWGIYPNGPMYDNVFDMDVAGDNLWVAPGGRTNSWGNAWVSDGLFTYEDNNWAGASYVELDSIKDITVICINPANSEQVFAGSWGYGVLEFNNGVFVKNYKENNTDSALQSVVADEAYIRIGGLGFDNQGNLWVTSTGVDNIISVKEPNGNWTPFQFQGFGLNTRVGEVLVDQRNWKWVLLPGNGILVFDENGTIDNQNDDQEFVLKNNVGSGNLPDKDVSALAEDMDGEIWVGTHSGISVFYSPELIFSGSDFDAQQILVQQDSSYQYLLEAEIITAIAIDGANRKWIGTETAGVFLMSEDGTEEVYHFTKDNSPLLSDNITSISINHDNGVVFFGTSRGLISYKSTATAGAEIHNNVYAYPNPVREGYEGVIAIKGLVTDADVKITDISGNLIYQTTALGGQAIWNGRNFNGQRAQTGVYLVFSTNADGTQKAVTKILFIN